jgi:hypothetical protein
VWASVFFDELWRLIPAQPVLFPFFFVGGLLSVYQPPAMLSFTALTLWSGLAIISPLLVLMAWWMIMYRSGFTRYSGFYIRLGGDLGQVIVLLTYIISLCNPPIYAAAVLIAVSAFVGLLVVRDFMAVVLVESVASRLYAKVHDDAAAR